jgi:AraC-like DNA-binding protein
MPKMHKDDPRAAVLAAAPGLAVTELLFEGVRDSIFCVKDRHRRYVAVSQAFVLRARVANRAALIGHTAREVFPPLLAAAYEQQDDAVFATGRPIRDKLELITNPDGTTGWYLTQKVPVRDGAGTVIALAAVSTDLRSPVDGDPRLAALGGAIERIQRDFGDPLRIADLARAARMSLSQFERRFAAVLGVSPRQLLTQTRVDAAARALRETAEPLNRIAVNCGFYDQAMFCRQFRAATGLTPGRYRGAEG